MLGAQPPAWVGLLIAPPLILLVLYTRGLWPFAKLRQRRAEAAATVEPGSPAALWQPIAALTLFPALVFGLVAALLWEHALSPIQGTFPLDASSVDVAGRPGDHVRFKLEGESVTRHWAASSGLDVEIGGERVPAVEPKERNWDDSIVVSGGAEDTFRILVDFEVPETVAAGGSTEGTLVGGVSYPSVSGGGFVNAGRDLEIPIELSTSEAAVAEARGGVMFGAAVLVTAIASLFLIGFPVALARITLRARRRSRGDPPVG
jgi:hypothetical protein